MTGKLKHRDFPGDFLFGAATSAYQIEGHAFGGAGQTHWDSFAAQPGKVANAETGARACDHYHLYEQDLELLRGFDAYRFSTSWARILPEGKGTVNQEGLDFYDRLVDAIAERGLEPFLTLYHWELPLALADKGGWTNPDIAHWFGDFTDIVMDRIGDRVASVATINEPWCISYLSHFLGHHAPGLNDARATAHSMHNVLRAHGVAMQRLRARSQENLGIVLNFEAVQPASPAIADQAAAKTHDAIMNRMFMQPLFSGTYPQQVLDGLGKHLPKGWQDDMALIQQPLDWLGVNYYTCKTVAADTDAGWPHLRFQETESAKTQMGWDIHPEGLFEILTWLQGEFIHDLPMYITENGMARDDKTVDGTVFDPERSDFIFNHLAQVHRALQQGCNIKGFFYWSLLDNYEWAFGYEKRFGLIHVDFGTQIRTPKNSFRALQRWLGV